MEFVRNHGGNMNLKKTTIFLIEIFSGIFQFLCHYQGEPYQNAHGQCRCLFAITGVWLPSGCMFDFFLSLVY